MLRSILSHQVHQLHIAMDQPVADKPTHLLVTDRDKRLRLILEEFLELVEHEGFNLSYCGMPISTSPGSLTLTHVEGSQQNLVEVADALGDLMVVIQGTAIEHGIPLDDVLDAIQDSNMSKLDEYDRPIINGVTEGYRCADLQDMQEDSPVPIDEPGYRSDVPVGKFLKGPDYVPPTAAIESILHNAGWDGQ